ncbi:hypothetical protein AGMMS49525_09580 [Bacteroidia bacterium]|nr:hypothetical protein AGMMS49525_09580 [Bacteroidia bacterium]
MKQVLLIITFLLSTFTLAAQKKKVAVFESFGTSVTDDVRQAVVDVLEEGIFNSKQYTVLEREQIEGVQKEFEFQQTGMVDDAQLSKMGKASGADYTCFASITAFGSNYQIACKLIETESAEMKYSKSMRTKRGMDDLGEVLEFIANEMFSGKDFKAQQAASSDILCPKCGQDGDEYVDAYISPNDEEATTQTNAITLCKSKGDDWYLPNKDELKAIYKNQQQIVANGGKKFQRKDYWTSSQRNNYDAYNINFSTGDLEYYAKTSSNVFRCLRLP